MLSILAVLFAIALLIYLSFRGWPVIALAMICALIVMLGSGIDIWEGFSKFFGGGFQSFVGTYFILMVLGSLFGKAMSDSGSAKAIAVKLLDIFGEKRATLVVILAGALMTYAGINIFIVVFTVYPIALVVAQVRNLPKHLMLTCLALGTASFTIGALPATPSVNNIVAAQVLGTTTTAAPVLGIFMTVVMFVLGYLYVLRVEKQVITAGEGFVPGPRDVVKEIDRTNLPNWITSFIPMLVVIGCIIGLQGKVTAIFSVWIGLLSATILVYLINWKRIEKPVKTLGDGLADGVIPLITISSIVGFGYVVQQTPAFQSFTQFALGLQFHPYVSAVIATNLMAGITGSSSGGLTIFLNALGQQYLAMPGVDPATLHRLVTVASGGLDSLPHSGGVIAFLTIFQLTHREAYKGICVQTLIIPIIAVTCGLIFALAF